MGAPEVGAFLTDLVVRRNVSASMQSQAAGCPAVYWLPRWSVGAIENLWLLTFGFSCARLRAPVARRG